MKRNHEILMIFLLLASITLGCKYVVIPEDLIAEQEAYYSLECSCYRSIANRCRRFACGCDHPERHR